MMNQVDRGHSVESRWTWLPLSATDLEDYLHLSTAFLMVYSKPITGLTIYLRWKRLFLFVRFNILNGYSECDRHCEGSQPNRKTGRHSPVHSHRCSEATRQHYLHEG